MTAPSVRERIRRANAPAPPDDSVPFRLATLVAVVVAILAAESVGEISLVAAAAAAFAVCLGMAFSYATRQRPWQWLKILLALTVVGVFAVFVEEILGAAHTGQLDSIEVPLAALFTWVQVVHAFDVPGRRDLLFSLAAGAALITIAGAQAVSPSFAVFAAVWLVATVVGLGCSWISMTGGTRPPSLGPVAGSLAIIVALGLALLVVLPAPRAAPGLTLPSSLTSYLPLEGSSIVNGSGPHATQPAHPSRPGGQLSIGGFEGFGRPLDTAQRAVLGDEVVMRVRADTPGYFLGLTYNEWNGQSWLESRNDRRITRLQGGSPFFLPNPPSRLSHATTNVQTFYVVHDLPNLLFATSQPVEVYFPSHDLLLARDGSIQSTVAMTAGTVYTVISEDDEVSPALLAKDRRPEPAVFGDDSLQLPHHYPRVVALVHEIERRAHAHSTEAIVTALEAWIRAHTHYSTDIPPLRPGEDAVDEFLFGNREGYCEQISTALAVMLRSIGIPAREAVGYVPGSFDPLSDMWEIEAKDAHAWVQVYFPGYGWQNFDPTANVPLAPTSPGTALLHDVLGGAARLPWAPIGSVAGVAGGSALAWRRRRDRPVGWPAQMARRLERLGAKVHVRRGGTETLAEYARRLELLGPGASAAAAVLERHAYSDAAAPSEEERAIVREAVHRLARAVWRRRLPGGKEPAQRASRAASSRAVE